MKIEQKYFNVNLEFDKTRIDSTIQTTVAKKGKGYICSVESNNLTVANKSPEFLKVVNGSLINICDGSVIAKILSIIYKQNFNSYIGADLFIKYIRMCKYKQFFLGNNREVLDGLRKNLSKIDPAISSMPFEELPFKKVEEFDYMTIAAMINKKKPDIIWVSLGAPKQEIFMSYLLPYLDQGVMFGFGAIFNFHSEVGKVRRAPKFLRNVYLEWLYRAYNEPRKNVPRYWRFIKILPKLIIQELRTNKYCRNVRPENP
jgi:N-acetylglucosaminyldiphosphoundecaprenol N-acetyl-beta-D-mannosaminyltransferase